MRDYGIVSPRFWTGKTGKALRGDPVAQLIAIYLMTSPHANMIGVYACPLLYITHETGCSAEDVERALARLHSLGFCTYDAAEEVVFVHRMMKHQLGATMKPGDKRHGAVLREWRNIGPDSIRQAFHEVYAVDFLLPDMERRGSPFEGASEAPLDRSDQDQIRSERAAQGGAPAHGTNQIHDPCYLAGGVADQAAPEPASGPDAGSDVGQPGPSAESPALPPKRGSKADREARGTTCPPSEASQVAVAAWAARWKLDPGHPEFAKFLDWHRSRRTKSFDWAASFRTWTSKPWNQASPAVASTVDELVVARSHRTSAPKPPMRLDAPPDVPPRRPIASDTHNPTHQETGS